MWIFNKKKKTEPETETRTLTGTSWASIFGLENYSRTAEPLKIGTAYACIRLNANAISQTQLHLFRRKPDGTKERVFDHPVLNLLQKPINFQTNYIWQNSMCTQFCGRGNGYSYIVREDGINVDELIFIPKDNVQIVETYIKQMPFFYRVTFNDGSNADVFPEDMVHYKNITTDGYTGISPVENHRLTFETSLSEEEYKKIFFDNAAQISGVIESDAKLTTETVKAMRENFGTIYGGAKSAGKTAVLGGGAKYKQIKPVSPQDADFLNSRKLTNEDIMRIYGVPPPMLGDVSATYANSEQLALIYQEYTVSPLLTNIEQELTLKLLVLEPDLFFEYVPDLSKMSTTRDKAETQAIYKREGIYTANELRAKNGDAPIKGGEALTLQMNNTPVKQDEKPTEGADDEK